METVLAALLKILEYFYDRRKVKDPKSKLCREMVRLYLLVKEFSIVFEELQTVLKLELSPLLIFYREDEDNDSSFLSRYSQILRQDEFTKYEISTLTSHIANYSDKYQNIVVRIVDSYNSLNQTRDEIFRLVMKAIPLSKLGIFFPELEEQVVVLAAVNISYIPKGGEASTKLISDSVLKRDAKRLNAMKYSFQTAFFKAINSTDKGEWNKYLRELDTASTKLVEIQDTMKEFIQQNCLLSEILL